MAETFHCTRCKKDVPLPKPGTTCAAGYALHGKSKRKICYACCAVMDYAAMEETGRADLYLVAVVGPHPYEVHNWPGSLKIVVDHYKVGRHNIAGKRIDIWFTDRNGAHWHGTRYGSNTDIVRCKRMIGRGS